VRGGVAVRREELAEEGLALLALPALAVREEELLVAREAVLLGRGGAAVVYLGLRLVGFHALFASDAEGIGALLQIIGTLYSVVYAFATYVIWGQFTSVENEIRKESGALKDLLLFSHRLKDAAREPMVRAVKIYARAVVETEWSALAGDEKTEKTERLFNEVISSVTSMKPEDDTERMLYERLLDIANQASAHRDESGQRKRRING